jgi:hypothetical protein
MPNPRAISGPFLISLVAGVLLSACGGSSPAAPRPTAALQLTPNPATVTPGPCPPSSCGSLTGQFEVLASVTVRETAGVAGTITRVTLNLRRQSDNASIAAGEAPSAAGTRFGGNGSVSVPIALHYSPSQGERNMKVVITVEAADDNSHQVSSTTELQVVS